jgi:DNA-binding GntR family transcriptional regulator
MPPELSNVKPASDQQQPSASEQVALGIVRALDQHRLVPGQRLIETDLALEFGVGRNAVREAIQRLAARGIVDLSRNRSPAVRKLSVDEALDVLDVAEAMTGLLTSRAAQKFDKKKHLIILQKVLRELDECETSADREAFSRARRHFYRALLDICGNSELVRLFSTIDMQIVYLQFQSSLLQSTRFADYRSIARRVIERNAKVAEREGRDHVNRVRTIVLQLAKTRTLAESR